VLLVVLLLVYCVFRKVLHGSNKDLQHIQHILKNAFLIQVKRIQRVTFELQRKAFHVAGLIIPSAYIASLQSGLLTRAQAAAILGLLAATQILIELARKFSPAFNRLVVARMRKTMRPDELKSVKVTGTPFFLTGNFLVVWLFPPTVAVMSQLYLVVGDFSAAFFGLAYGRTAIYGNKSLEGSSACFFSCILVGMTLLLWSVPLIDYPTALFITAGSSLLATVVELISDDGIFNDNLTIPLSSAISISMLAKMCKVSLVGDGVLLNYD